MEAKQDEQKLESQGFYVGVDLGQAQDYSAVVIAERLSHPISENADGQELLDEFHIRHCERLPLGTSYEDQKQHIKKLITHATRKNPDQQITLIVDATGVGRPVIDSMRGDGLKPIPVTVHGGQSVTCDESGWHVPKRDLVAAAKVLLGKKQLKIGRGLPFADVLINELQNFQVKVNIATGHDSYEAWREGAHDDLVFAVSLACWYAFTRRKRREEPTYIPKVMRRANPAHIYGV
jgi:hypothetical protein